VKRKKERRHSPDNSKRKGGGKRAKSRKFETLNFMTSVFVKKKPQGEDAGRKREKNRKPRQEERIEANRTERKKKGSRVGRGIKKQTGLG